MKILPIAKKIVDSAFAKEKDIEDQLKKLAAQSPSDSFWASHNAREFHENGKGVKKIGDVWRCDFHTSNSQLQEAYAIWRDYPNYYGSGNGKSMYEVLALSETEKILYTCGEFRVVLLRDTILDRTENHWGFRIQRPVYALINNKTDEVIIREEKSWRFKKLLLNDLHEQKSKSFIDELKKLNPFKLFIVKATETEKLDHVQDKLEMSIDTPTQRFLKDLTKNNLWVCYALGYGSKNYQKNRTWWFVESEDKPTNEEAIVALVGIINWYNANSYTDMLKKYKEYNYDLNRVDLEDIELKWDQVTRKLKYHVYDVFNVDSINDIDNVINEFSQLD